MNGHPSDYIVYRLSRKDPFEMNKKIINHRLDIDIFINVQSNITMSLIQY